MTSKYFDGKIIEWDDNLDRNKEEPKDYKNKKSTPSSHSYEVQISSSKGENRLDRNLKTEINTDTSDRAFRQQILNDISEFKVEILKLVRGR